jgi:peptide-methionine (S)-S-oxide reductase
MPRPQRRPQPEDLTMAPETTAPDLIFQTSRVGLARRSVTTGLLALGVVAAAGQVSRAAEPAGAIPPPAADEPVSAGSLQTVVLAGGCFWGVQAVYQHVEGVHQAVSGYAGGASANPTYEQVSTGRTGYAESVQVTFDPHKVSLGKILQIFFSVAHDPTQLNRQGPDFGTQYRSAIFYSDESVRRVAQSYVSQLGHASVFRRPIVTRIDPLTKFYPAEAYHQDYALTHPNSAYIVFNDLPKVDNLKLMYPGIYREQPVTVASMASKP